MAKRRARSAQARINQELRRISRAAKRLSERGYFFPEGFTLPSTLRSLKKFTTERLYKVAQYYDPETGKYVSGKEGRKLERSRAAKKGYATRVRKKIAQEAIDNFEYEWREYGPSVTDSAFAAVRDFIYNYDFGISTGTRNGARTRSARLIEAKQRAQQRLREKFDEALSQYGEERYARYLATKYDEISEIIDSMKYGDSDQNQVYTHEGRLAALISPDGITMEENMDISEAEDMAQGIEMGDNEGLY